MLYCLFVDDEGKISWSQDSLERLFEQPLDCENLVNTGDGAQTQIMLGGGCHSWEVVRPEKRPEGAVIVRDGTGNLVDEAPLVPNTLYNLRPEGINVLLGVRRGESGFESIETGELILMSRLPWGRQPIPETPTEGSA